jgi:hypothetical protein
LNFQKELSDLQVKASNKENLMKKDMEYKQALLDKTSQKLA